jgi:hypothetical protein
MNRQAPSVGSKSWTVAPRVKVRAGLGLLVLMALMAAATVCQADMHPNTRQGWLVGFSVGGGSAGITQDGNSGDREGGTAASFRGGYGFNEDISLELNGNLWTKEQDGATVTFSATTAAINFYPGHSGLVLRAGIGGGSGDASVQVGSVTVSGSESGLGFTAGAAYEFRVTRSFALGPQVDYGFASLDSFDANWVNFGLGFNWYFTSDRSGPHERVTA